MRYGLRFPGFWINFQSGCLSIVRLTWIGYPSGIVLFFHVSPYICTYSNTLFKYIAQSRCSCLKGHSNVWGPMMTVMGLHMTNTNSRMNTTIIHAGVNIWSHLSLFPRFKASSFNCSGMKRMVNHLSWPMWIYM